MKRFVAIFFACCAAANSQAGMLPPEQNQQVRSRTPDAKPHRPREQMALNRGVVDSVDAGSAEITVYGNKIAYDARKIKVFKGRQDVGISTLRAGSKIRYLFDGTGPDRKISRIWIED